MMKAIRMIMTVAVVLLGLQALLADVCYWKPSAGSGSWDDPNNWEGGKVPVSGRNDFVWLTNLVEGAEITVPGTSFSLNNFWVGGNGKIFTLKGGKLIVNNVFRLDTHAVVNNDLEFNGEELTVGCQVGAGNDSVFNGNITIASSRTRFFLGGRSPATFNGTITGLNSRMGPCRVDLSAGRMTFNGAVRVKDLYYADNSYWGKTIYRFAAAGNEWGGCDLGYTSIEFGAANAMCATMPFSWGVYRNTSEENSSYRLNGWSQVADRIETPANAAADHVHYISTTAKASVLLRGTADATAACWLNGPLTLLWAPTGDYTQTLTTRASTLSGDLVVSNGTLCVGAGASLPNARTVTVAGGRFLVSSSVAKSLASVIAVDIANGATFEIGSGADPLTTEQAVVRVRGTGVLKIPDAYDLTVTSFAVDGLRLTAGDYTGTGGAVGTEIPQIQGKGRIRVLDVISPTGKTCVWKGGSGNWSVGANWQDGEPPQDGDGVLLSASSPAEIVNDISGLALDKLSFSGSAPLRISGESVRLLGKTAFENAAGENVWITNALPIVLMDGVADFVQDGKRICVMEGVISGTGGIQAKPSGVWHWCGANTFAGGVSLSAGEHSLWNATAFGASRSVGVSWAKLNACVKDAVYPYDLSLTGNTTVNFKADGAHFGAVTATDAYQFTAGMLDNPGAGWNGYFDGPVTAPNQTLSAINHRSGNTVHFMDKVTVKRIRTDEDGSVASGAGHFAFHAADNVWTSISVGWNGIDLFAVDALCKTVPLVFVKGCYSDGCMTLNGCDQTVPYIQTTCPFFAPADTTKRVISSDAPATLVLNGTMSAATDLSLGSGVSLAYNPADASCVETLSNRTHVTAGTLACSNGTLRIGANTSFANLSRLVVGGTGTIDVQTGVAGAFAGLVAVEAKDDGKVLFGDVAAKAFAAGGEAVIDLSFDSASEVRIPEGVILRVNSLTVDGQPVEGGRIVDYPQITGGGSVYVADHEVPTVTATWTGGAGANSSVGEAANWGGSLPPLTTGGLVATFANGGTAASFATECTFKGVVFAGAAARDFTLGSAGGSLALREAGIVQSAALTNVVTVPLVLKTAQTWETGAGSRLEVRADVDSPFGAMALAKKGGGTLALYGDNGISGAVAVSNGCLEVWGATNGVGVASDENGVFVDQTAGGKLMFCANGVCERPIDVKVNNTSGGLVLAAGVTNRFTKTVRSLSSAPRYDFGTGSCAIFEGGFMATSDWFCPVAGAGAEFIVRTVAAQMSYFQVPANMTARFLVAGNRFGTLVFPQGGVVRLEAAGAIGVAPPLSLEAAGAVLDLCGNDETVQSFVRAKAGTVRTDDPATLTFEQSAANVTNEAVAFAGALSLCKRGAKRFSQNCDIPSVGSLTVESGEFEFLSRGRWKSCTGVTVGENGQLTVARTGRIFGKTAVLSVEQELSGDAVVKTGLVRLESGVRLSVAGLVVGGKPLPEGLYGATAKPGRQALSCLAGSGELFVGEAGLAITVR